VFIPQLLRHRGHGRVLAARYIFWYLASHPSAWHLVNQVKVGRGLSPLSDSPGLLGPIAALARNGQKTVSLGLFYESSLDFSGVTDNSFQVIVGIVNRMGWPYISLTGL
jgi:hypothetical protein